MRIMDHLDFLDCLVHEGHASRTDSKQQVLAGMLLDERWRTKEQQSGTIPGLAELEEVPRHHQRIESLDQGVSVEIYRQRCKYTHRCVDDLTR